MHSLADIDGIIDEVQWRCKAAKDYCQGEHPARMKVRELLALSAGVGRLTTAISEVAWLFNIEEE